MATQLLSAAPKTRKEPQLLTGADLLAMGDIGPCELIEGRIVHMSPTKIVHGRLESRFDRILGEYVEAHDLGEVMVGEVGIYVQRNPDTIRVADLLFISHERLDKATPDDFLDVAPELVVEIMSPSGRWSEVRKKLREYFAAGVIVVLVVEPDEGIVSAFRSPGEAQEFAGNDVLIVEDVLPGFSVPVTDLFATRKRR